MTHTINGIDEMKALVGEHVGSSSNTHITPEPDVRLLRLIAD